jgi:putative hemolysin
MTEVRIKKLIDVGAVLKQKSPTLYKFLPGFVIKWIRKKIHEDEINIGINNATNLTEHPFNESCLAQLGAKISWEGEQNLPKTGGVIIVSNHPLGGLDGMAVIKAVGSVREDVRFLVNDMLLGLQGYGKLFVGVNKVGKTGSGALKIIDEVYSSEHAVLVFPAGLVSRKQNGNIVDLEWKKSFVTQAIKHKRMIIPVFVEGKNSNFFYNLALWRKRLGIKANIEMFFLPDEMFKQRNKFTHIKFGKAFSYEVFDKTRSAKEWAQEVKEYVYKMRATGELEVFGKNINK